MAGPINVSSRDGGVQVMSILPIMMHGITPKATYIKLHCLVESFAVWEL